MDATITLPDDPASAWAAPTEEPLVSPRVRGMLAQIFDVDSESATVVEVLPPGPSLLGERARIALHEVVGEANVKLDNAARAAHANGMSYLDLVRRGRDAIPAPDAIVLPADEDDLAAVLAICAERGVAVVPFGGGTSVVGGVAPYRGTFAAVVALDLARFDRLVALDEVSRIATLEAGLTGPRAEDLLAERGFTLGHVPQSFERATIGGYAATRSAGSLSTGWGRFDELVENVRAVTPVGTLDLGRAPGTAAGPDLRQLVLGSEGAFGVITEVTVRVRPLPELRRHEGWRVASFTEGAALLRRLAQDGPLPDMARLADEAGTAIGIASAGEEPGDGCLLLVGWEGGRADVEHRAALTGDLLRAAGAEELGEGAAASWQSGRFRAPRLRDELLPSGMLAETLETATTWSNVANVHAAVGEAIRSALDGARPLVTCHISHLYAAGCSLYFSVLARADEDDPAGQWLRAKHAANDALVASGATITHHHAVGADHAAWMESEVGEPGVALLRAVKAHLDPAGILNPGKLIP